MSSSRSTLSVLGAAWAIIGWSAVLVFAILRLGHHALEALFLDLTPVQFSVLVLNSLIMLWAEGYRGFQQRFSPRAAARVLYLWQNPRPLTALLAPFFCVGYFQASASVLRLTWTGTALIVMLVLVFQVLEQPWRGILDAGVVLGLSWGLLSFLALCWKALRSGNYPADPQVPGESQRL